MFKNKDIFATIVTAKQFARELQVEEATVRAAGTDKDQRKEIDAMLSSLGVAPVSGTHITICSTSYTFL